MPIFGLFGSKDPLAVGTPAPDFEAKTESGETVKLSALGRPVALIFYPADETPRCTMQLCAFRDAWENLQAQGIQVFGVNPGAADSHRAFRQSQQLPFPLLVDEKKQIAKAYRCDGLIVQRTVYAIDAKGMIRMGERGVSSPGRVMDAFAG